MEEEQEAVTRADFDSWYEWIDYISFGSCASCSSGRFYVLLGVLLMLVVNIGLFVSIMLMI